MYLMVLNKLYNLLGDSASLAGQTLNKFSVAISIEVEIKGSHQQYDFLFIPIHI